MNLQLIFEEQTRLMVKYHRVEAQVMGTLPHPTRVLHQNETQDIHVHEHIRSLLWKCLEELGEAARECNLDEVPNAADVSTLFKVELIDALHFLTEACTFANIPVEEFESIDSGDIFSGDPSEHYLDTDDFSILVGRVSLAFADATYCLKGKPWKQDKAVTDWGDFRKKMVEAYEVFMVMLSFFMTSGDIGTLYQFKKTINEQRVESGY